MRSWVAGPIGLIVTVLATTGALGPSPAGATSAPKPVTATSAAALAAAVTDRGLTCDPFVDSADSGAPTIPGGPPNGDTGECVIDGVTGSISVYESPRQLARALAAMPLVCRFAVAVLGPVEFTFVTGRNWSISFFRDEYEPAVGKALGGKVRDVDCTARAKR